MNDVCIRDVNVWYCCSESVVRYVSWLDDQKGNLYMCPSGWQTNHFQSTLSILFMQRKFGIQISVLC